MKQYKCVFFDLDHTLWDYDKNSRESLIDLYDTHSLEKLQIDFDKFHDSFQLINTRLWDLYDRGLIDRWVIRNERFRLVLEEMKLENDKLADQLADLYFHVSPTKRNLIPNAIETLDYLKEKYPLYLLTNGFEQMQMGKVDSSGIRKYFIEVITSERVGHKKPAKEFFDFALQESGFPNTEAIMIGDNHLTDIAGANNAAIDSVLFNPKQNPHASQVNFEISDLIELKRIL